MTIDMEMSLGDRIRYLRKSKKLTLAELATILGRSINSIYRWEHDLAIPKKSAIEAITKYFKISQEWLLSGGAIILQYEKTSHEKDISIEELALIRGYRRLRPSDKATIQGFIWDLATTERNDS